MKRRDMLSGERKELRERGRQTDRQTETKT
jgi:hypothetical protein